MPRRSGLRAVTHFDVSTEQCKQALKVILGILDEPEKYKKPVSNGVKLSGTSNGCLVGPEAKTMNGYGARELS